MSLLLHFLYNKLEKSFFSFPSLETIQIMVVKLIKLNDIDQF